MPISYFDYTILFVLILFSGFFSAAETALLSFKNLELDKLEKSNPTVHASLKYWLKNPNGILSTILIANNVTNVLVSSITTSLVATYYSKESAVLLSTFVATLVLLLFGEITPKLIGKNYALSVSRFVITPLTFISRILYPLVFCLTQASKLVGRLFGLNIVDKEIATVTESDLRSLISVSGQEGVIEKDRREMLNSILDFSDLTVSDLVVPRQDVFMLKATDRIIDVLPEIINKGFSRVPIYDENFDNIVGALYVKDMLPLLKEGDFSKQTKNLMRDIIFVPDTKNALSLLKEFKEQRVHIAAVVDEYGGTVGIITIEDVIERVVGDIKDEFDQEEPNIREVESGKFLIRGSMDIEEINEKTGLEIPESEEYDSLGGFINFLLGRVPVKGETVNWGNIEIIVKNVDRHAVKYAVVTKHLPQLEEEEEIED